MGSALESPPTGTHVPLAAAFLLMVSETALSNGLSRQRVKEKEVVAAAE